MQGQTQKKISVGFVKYLHHCRSINFFTIFADIYGGLLHSPHNPCVTSGNVEWKRLIIVINKFCTYSPCSYYTVIPQY